MEWFGWLDGWLSITCWSAGLAPVVLCRTTLHSDTLHSLQSTLTPEARTVPVLRMFGHDGELNTCGQSVPKKFRDGMPANENQ